jgi:protein O-GlcNAc transferase
MLGKIRKLLGNDKPASAQVPASASATGSEAADLLIAEGNRADESGDLVTACERYRRAVQLAPRYAKAHLNLGIGLEAIGKHDDACRSYEAALAVDPEDVFANYNLGRQLFSRNALAEAQPLLRRAIAGNPKFVEARVVLARLLETTGDFNRAAIELEEALRVRPDYFGALCNYADLLVRLQRPEEAIAALRRAVAAQPANSEVGYKLACLLAEAGNAEEAERYAQQAVHCDPDFANARALLVNLYMARGSLADAATQAEAALNLHPQWLDLLFNYGLILNRSARQAEAENAFRRAIAIDQTYLRAYQMLGAVQISQGRIQDALDTFAEGRKHCTDTFDLESPELFALICKDDITMEEIFTRHVDYGRRLEQSHLPRFASFGNVPDPGRRLRVGFVSADFRYHVVTLFLLPFLEARDRSLIEVYCYSTGDTADSYTARLRDLADVWRMPNRMPPADFADLIHRDGVDILVDLAGHSSTPNLRVFAYRPAPVQATWLGYLNTTGLRRIQYRISDPQCDPPDLTSRFHTEQLLRLPGSQWCYRPFIEVECEREAPFRRNDRITFGSFNQIVKITPAVRKLWGRILTEVTDSKLVVVGVVDARAQEDLHRDLERAGVDRARVTMIPYVAVVDYYRWFGRVDIALDTMPFSGGTTTFDALWMGAPVITCPGERSWSRSAASILTTLGLTDFIAKTPDDYVQRAVQLANNLEKIAQMRQSLRARMMESPLMDKRLFARNMEHAFRQMWQLWCSNPGD